MALSTTEYEYIALIEAIKEAIWLIGIIGSLGLEINDVFVQCDSQNTICIAKNPMYHERTKNVDMELHFIQDIVAND